MSAIATFCLEDGMMTSSWPAVVPFRMRVSMSAIGSVMVISTSPARLRDARQLTEGADGRECDRQQAVEEFPHPVAAQRSLRADRLALAELEVRDRLARLGDERLLAGDRREVLGRAVDQLHVLQRLADAHVD